jgi:multidrug efflux pump subunit AcrB
MKHWDERTVPAQALVGDFYMRTGGFKEGLALAFNAPAIFALGATGGFEMHLQSHGDGGAKRLAEVSQMFIGRAMQEPGIAQAQMFWRPNVPQLFVDVDREKAKALGVPIDEVFNALAATLGTYYVNDFNKYGRTWQVLMSSEARYRKRPEDVGSIYVRSDKGEMVPVGALANVQFVSGPDTLERFNNLPAVTILGSGAPGVSSGQVLEKIEKVAREALPADFSFDWSGASLQEKRSGGTSIVALVAGALMAFLILAAQYERWSLPLSVMLALPFGTFGALAAIWINNLVFTHFGRGPLTNDVYFQIGLVTLLGLAAKNAILIVEYALMKSDEGLSYSAAAVEAARLRFRPILMTSLAFILGVLPLVISSGAGAGARHSVGTGVMGGMLAATFMAIFFVPFFFKLIMSRKLGEPRSSQELKDEATHHREIVAHPAPHEAVRTTPRTEGNR